MQVSYKLKDQTLELLPEKCIFWQERKMLIIADAHSGKAGHFRKAGIPVPGNISSNDTLVIEKLIFEKKPQIVLFLGDLFHSDFNLECEMFSKWRKNQEVEMILVKGNHDILEERFYKDCGVQVVFDYYDEGPFTFSHHPMEMSKINPERYIMAGHIHPGIILYGKAKQSLKLPCFVFSQNQALLPAFGSFTGTFPVKVKSDDDLYVISEGKVLEISVGQASK